MSDHLLALLPEYGGWLIAVSAFLSCMMVPVPTSVLLVAAGSGHLSFLTLALAGASGAALGDFTAFLLARRMQPLLARLGPRTAAVLQRAQDFIARRGMMAVFLSRWLVSPLGPSTNYVAGAAGLSPARFLLASIPGEAIWAVLHLAVGHLAGRGFRGHEAPAFKALAAGLVVGTVVWLILRWLRHNRPPRA